MKIDREQVFDVIKIVKDLDKIDSSKNYDLIEDLGFGSFDFVALMGELWMKFDVKIESSEFVRDNFRTVSDLMTLINK